MTKTKDFNLYKRDREDTLSRSLSELIHGNKEGSFGTQAARSAILHASINKLKEEGFSLKSVKNLKQKHVHVLLNLWRERGLATSTIKNNMTHLRWLARKINNPRIIERTNRAYEIPNRKYVNNGGGKARNLDRNRLDRITNSYVNMSLRLQEAFGLRREESIKIQPDIADKGDRLYLKDSWCKGKIAREVLIRNPEQRAILDEVKLFCRENGSKSLIPSNLQYKQQLKAYEYQTSKVGLSSMHGLRHRYAQTLYRDLTGWEAPNAGGPKKSELTVDQKKLDRMARLQISRELGHQREEITAVYLGR